MDDSFYKEKKKKEKEWYELNNSRTENYNFIQKLLHSRVIWSQKRREFSYYYGKKRMERFLAENLNGKVDKLLIAPVGYGDDYKYVKHFSNQIYGIDLSPKAVSKCNQNIILNVGDILNTEFSDEFFDVIVCPLFFHHIVSIGFDPFLIEFYRILKKEGFLVILDFSQYYPLNAFTRPLKKIFKNPFGEVEDEKPYRPKLMIKSLKKRGFTKIQFKGANFSHCSFPIPLAKVINFLTKPLLNNRFLSNFSWLVLFSAIKK